MILEKLALTDFRVFEGRHEFDLSPRVKRGKKRPVVLFGGLNGAGKTTTLTAVRLALYGKQCLGLGVSKRVYDDFLTKSIHKSKSSLFGANSACIELTFSYASMGIIKHYTVVRQWVVSGSKVVEDLSIAEDGETLSELNYSQCQGFLNELIPIGVSDLFFFDGEKIAELAEDTGGLALGDSIKRLLGLDLVETLDADLGLIKRDESKKRITGDMRAQVQTLETTLNDVEKQTEDALQNWQIAKSQTAEHAANIDLLERDLASRGGAWAATREEEITRQAKLQAEKLTVEHQLRDILAGAYPIAIAADFAKLTITALRTERDSRRQRDTNQLILKHLESLNKTLSAALDKANYTKAHKAITDEFDDHFAKDTDTAVVHDLSDSAIQRIEIIVDSAISHQLQRAKDAASQLARIDEDIDAAGMNIARAPEEEVIKPTLKKIKDEQSKRDASLVNETRRLEEYKRLLRYAMDVTRKLDKAYGQIGANDTDNRVEEYATRSRSVLKEFSKELAKRKVQDLEKEFVDSFQRLARKGDVDISADIDPQTFSVRLIDKNEQEIDKNDLSAGEKQIYAISILEALGKTSGRKLPIIIDTPLGRLDSKHRQKLINNYFPSASHQVIILSTDTEVDEAFYSQLSPSISHAFKLDYDSETGATSAKEGYFWRSKNREPA
tara:strand:- start:6824 stop:8830 length:2007 start_codon:yes stop_codon:yes gene_type:complete